MTCKKQTNSAPPAAVIIHVDSAVIRANRKRAAKLPPILVRRSRSGRASRTFSAPVHDAAGNVVAVVEYDPDRPLKCGAVCWVRCLHTAPPAGQGRPVDPPAGAV